MLEPDIFISSLTIANIVLFNIKMTSILAFHLNY